MDTLSIQAILDYLTNSGVHYRYKGTKNLDLTGFSSITNYRQNTFTWVRTQQKLKECPNPKEIALLFAQEGIHTGSAPNVIDSKESKRAFFSVIERFYAAGEQKPSISAGSYISPQVKLGRNVSIGCHCVLDGDIIVGDNTIIWHNVSILNRVTIGSGCVIQSGAVIGHDGFAFTEDDQKFKTMVRHYGGVRLENDVWIGPNTDVIRGTIDDTVIGANSKIDACCHIAHNVVMEESCGIVAGSIVMGSVHLGRGAYVASANIRDQSVIGEGALIGMSAAVVRDVPAGDIVAGVPAVSLAKRKLHPCDPSMKADRESTD